MSNIRTYRWVPLDQVREAGAPFKPGQPGDQPDRHYVTPYAILSGRIPDAKKLKGDKSDPLVAVDLDMSNERGLYVDRFFPKGDYVWEAIPAELLGAESFGELCDKLYKSNPNKYVKEYYAPERIATTSSQKDRMPHLMFDFWDNTELRYDVVTGKYGAFSWDMDPKKLPTGGKGVQWKALVKKAVPEPKPVAPAKNNAITADETAALVQAGRWLSLHASKLHEIVRVSAEAARDRTFAMGGLNALYVLFACCGQGPLGAPCNTLAQGVAEVLPDFRGWARDRPLPAPKPKATTGIEDPRLAGLNARLAGYSSDLSKDLEHERQTLIHALFEDDQFRDLCSRFLKGAIDAKETATPKFRDTVFELMAGMADALHALSETPGTESDAEELLGRREKACVARPTSSGQIQGRCAYEVMLSFVGHEYWAPSELLAKEPVRPGNLAGVPNISLVLGETYTSWNLAAWATAAQTVGSKFKSILDSATRLISPGDEVVRAQLVAASLKNDQRELDRLFEEMGKAADAEGSVGMTNVLGNVKSLVTMVSAISDAVKSHTGTTDRVYVTILKDVKAGAATAQFAIGTVDTIVRALNKMPKAEHVLRPAKLAGGALTGALSIVDGAATFAEAYEKGRPAGMISGGATFGAGVCGVAEVALLVMGMNPTVLVAAGAVLTVVAISAALYDTPIPLNDDREKLRSVGLAVFRKLEANDFYAAMVAEESAFATKMAALKASWTNGAIEMAPNTAQIVESLRVTGFDLARDIPAIVGSSTPIDNKLLAIAGSRPELLVHAP